MQRKILLSFVLAAFCFTTAIAQQQSLNWINEHALPLDSTSDAKYLLYLTNRLKENTILGLGEASHGTHEFSTEKNRIIRHLIANADYRSIGFEFSYSVIDRINKYLITRNGNLIGLMAQLRLFNNREICDLFEFITVYNAGRSLKDKITIFGFDTDYIKSDIDSSAVYCINYLTDHVNVYTKSQAAIQVFKKIASPNFNNLYELTDDEMATIADLNNDVKGKKEQGEAFDRFRKHLSLLYQGTLISNPLARDEFMAENIANIQQAHKTKTIIWSHNVHVAKDTTMAMCKGMGYYLKQRYGDRYYNVAFDTFKGSANSIIDDAFKKNSFEMQPSSLSALFAKAKYTNFFIDFANPHGNPLYNVAGNITNIFSNWGSMRTLQIIPGIDFDALIFTKETTASQPL